MKDALGYIQNMLFQLKISLADWLTERLEKIDEEYWNTMVLPKLSYYQNQMIEKERKTKLQDLDLTCILRIFDKNWYDLSFSYNFKTEIRSYVKELQIMRNKYAHLASDIPVFEINSDLQIIKSLLNSLNIDNLLQQKIEGLLDLSIKDNKNEVKQTLPISQYINDLGDIRVNDIVKIKAYQNKMGVVLKIIEDEYTVFVDGEVKPLYKSQIAKIIKEDAPFISLTLLRNYLSSYVIRHPTTSRLYSLNAARIDLIPYQFKPVMKIVNADQPRLLIADSVGIGKTIEAGLILRELQIRNNVKSVLIICPKPLVAERKWEQEMKRFDEDFETLDSSKLRYCIKECDLEGEWPERYQKVILPYSVCDKECLHQLEKLKPFPKFDLIIVDEAHHIRNQSAIRYQVIKKFCETAEAVVFLTATPVQLGNDDLYVLLNLLRPDLIVDEETFRTIHTPNKYITQAVQNVKCKNFSKALENLQMAVKTEGGKFISDRPDFKEITENLKKQEISRECLVDLVIGISRLHTFNSLINRTLRKEISSEFCVRHPETIRTAMTSEEEDVFTGLMNIKANILRTYAGIENINFVMTTLERQAASCIHGLAPLIRDILHKTFDFDCYDNENDDNSEINNKIFESYQKQIDDLVIKANLLGNQDPKYDAFFKIIKEKQFLENKKVIVFSTFRHTLSYLYNRLQNNNIRVGLIHGGIKDEERETIRKRFEKDSIEADALDVLLFSEVGCEGLDYQFCDTMINYDLPWNPMRIEQRIGRIDRFGQKSEAVAIYNMIVDNTIDAHIYDRCLTRIKIFEQSIGDCDEILGDIHSEIRAVCLNTTLTDEQKQEKLERIGENQYRYMKEQQELEKQQAALFVIPDKLSSLEKIDNFEDYWVSPIALENLASAYLKDRVSNSFTGAGARRTLRLSKDDRERLFEDYLKLPIRKGKIYKDWEKYLKGDDQYCSLTFDIKQASKERNIQFIMPLHPLILAAAERFNASMPIKTSLQIVDNDIPEGEYPFMVYSWEYVGNTPSVKLKSVCDNPIIAQNILTFLETGAEINEINVDSGNYDRLKKLIHQHWQEEISLYREKVNQQINYQINSLKISSAARKNVAERNNLISIREKIISNIEQETLEKISKLKEQAEMADILSTQILSGVIKIIHE